MKKFLSLSVLALFFFASCQKEVEFQEIKAQYSFVEGTSSCTDATVSGIYQVGTPAKMDNNKVVLKVIVDSIGVYSITTDAIDGLSFSGSGMFTSTGAQTITLVASGTPTKTGIYNFTPFPGGCTFPVPVTDNSGEAGGTASYTFSGGTSSCTGALVNGTFTQGTATSSGNTVILNVTVETIGTYNITTNAVNGISFSGSGNFTAEGTQTVTLTASGTPAASGNFDFSPGSNACSFSVMVNSSGGGPISGSDNFLRCKIDGVLSNFNTSLIGYYVPPPAAGIPYSLSVNGKSSDVAGSPIELIVAVTNPGTPTTGVYTNRIISMDMDARACQVSWFPTGFPNAYWSASVLFDNTLTLTLSSFSSSGASGTFSGTIYDINGGGTLSKEVTEGEFKITF